MPTIELTLRRPHINQHVILNSRARFRIAACGRRFGKTEVGKHEIIKRALMGGRCWWLAPVYKEAMNVWRDIRNTLRPMEMAQVIASEHTIIMPNGGFLAIRSTHAHENLRGAGLDFAVMDEAAFMHPDVWPQVVRPMLLEAQGSAMFLSSPNGRNHFWELYQLGLDPLETDWASFHFTSYDNPLVLPEEVEAIKRTTPERIFREEYLAEFVDDAGQVFRNVKERAVVPKGQQPISGHHYVFGVDWARDADFTVIAITDVTSKRLVAMDRFNQINWSVQRGRLIALYQKWKPKVIWAEGNSFGGPNIEALQAEGLPVRSFQTTALSKGPLIEALALAIERGDVELLNDPVLINELVSYRIERLPGGGYRYGAPAGGHDDTVIAAALSWHGANQGGRVSFVEFA